MSCEDKEIGIAAPFGHGGGLPVPPEGGHVDSENYISRDVFLTAKNQLEVALFELRTKAPFSRTGSAEGLRNMFESFSVDDVSKLTRGSAALKKKWLQDQSAKKIPSALGIISGITSPPFRVFSIGGLDLLHCLYLGPVRQFCDDAYKLFQSPSFSLERSKINLVRAANMRCMELPSSTSCRGFRPFKGVERDKQANFTGKQRRDLLPFLWYAVLGLNATLSGVNRAPRSNVRTAEEIKAIQLQPTKLFGEFIACSGYYETSKLHQLRAHLQDHFLFYGSIRYSDTGRNESLHKGVKKAYLSTNKRLSEIGPQLLQVNIAAELSEAKADGSSLDPIQHHLLLTRDPRTLSESTCRSSGDTIIEMNEFI